MEDEEGQPTPTETPEPAPTESQGEPVQSAPPSVPPKYAGKTPEELTSILGEQEKLIGRQGQELGQLRDVVERMYVAQQGGQRFEERPQQREPDPQFDYERPWESVDKRVDAKLSKVREWYEQSRRAEVIQRSTAALNRGQEIMKQNPHLFSGIENDVVNLVVKATAPAVQQGQDVSYLLENPQIWRSVALLIKDNKGELDKILAPPRKGMAPTDTELPTQTRQAPDDEGIILEDSDRKEFEEIHGRKGNDKEIREMVKLGLKTVRRR